jgi:methylmalonyl-CoA/ethylmalonyl-CoA epimerase
MKLKLDHIGYVVKDLKLAINYFKETYGFKILTKNINEKAHGVKLAFLDLGLNTRPALEVIQPTSNKSKVHNFLMTHGEGLHHLAYEVNNLLKDMEKFTKKGFIQISSIVPGAGHNQTKTIWLLGKKKELVELIEKQKNKKVINRFTK